MPLSLYRRHTSSCPIRKSKLSAKAKRAAMGCTCPIWMYGRTATTLVPRQSTGCTDLAEAEALRAKLTAEGKSDAVHGPRLAECIEKYLASRRSMIGEKTLVHHKLLLERLQTYCAKRGVYFMRELSVDLLETFKVEGLPAMADTTKATAVAKLRCFLREAHRRDWVASPLWDKVTRHHAVYEQKEPYTDAEVDKILTEALKLNGGTHGYSAHPRTFRLLLELMLETGMRVGDAVRFNPAQCVRGETGLYVYTFQMQKRKRTQSPKPIEAYITPALYEAIATCVWLSPHLPFFYGTSKDPSHLSGEVHSRMQLIESRCGVADCRPHRLRDTFAVRALLRGVPLEDVSRLLGHSSVKVTEAYYAKWTSGRKLRLERLLAETCLQPSGNVQGDSEGGTVPAARGDT